MVTDGRIKAGYPILKAALPVRLAVPAALTFVQTGTALMPMPEKGWRRSFEDPVPLPDGGKLVTLRDAGEYIAAMPPSEQALPEWQTAAEVLLMAAEDRGPLMYARIGMLRALNRHVEREFNPGRKDTHWGKRKLARDR